MNKGIVESTNIGLGLASGDIIVTLDADAQHDPSEIPSIVRPIAQDFADLVLGRRDNGRPVSERIISEIVSLRNNTLQAGLSPLVPTAETHTLNQRVQQRENPTQGILVPVAQKSTHLKLGKICENVVGRRRPALSIVMSQVLKHLTASAS